MMLVEARLTANEAEMVTALRRAREEMSRLRRTAKEGAQGNDEITRSSRQATEATAGFAGGIRQLRGLIAGIGAGLLAREIIQTGLAADAMEARFRTAAGGIAEGDAAMERARETAERLGLDLLATERGFSGLLAAARGTPIAPLAAEIFEGVATAAAALQLPADQVQGALTAIEQVMSKGTVQAEELRGQLGERIPGAFQIAARAMGVTTSELNDMLEAGEVLSEDFLPRFARQLREEFGASAIAAADGATAEFNRFVNSVTEAQRAFSQSGFLDGLTDGLRTVVAALSEPGAQAAIAQLGTAAGNSLSFVAENAADLSQAIAGVVATRFAATLIGWGRSATAAAAGVGALRGAIAALGGPVGVGLFAVGTALAALPFVLRSSDERIAQLTDSTEAARSAMQGYAEASRQAASDQEDLGGKVRATTQRLLEQSRAELQGALADLGRDLSETLSEALDTGISEVLGSDNLASVRSQLIGAVVEIRSELDDVVGAARASARGFAEPEILGSVFGPLVEMLNRLEQGDTGVLPDLVAELSRVQGVGEEAKRAAIDAVEAFEGLNAIDLGDAQSNILRVAGLIGGLEPQIRAVLDAQGEEARSRAIGTLANELLRLSRAGAVLRESGPAAFVEMLEAAGASQQEIARVRAALDGTLTVTEDVAAAAPTIDFSAAAGSASALAGELERAGKALVALQAGQITLDFENTDLEAQIAALEAGASEAEARIAGAMARSQAEVAPILAQDDSGRLGRAAERADEALAALEARETGLERRLVNQQRLSQLLDQLDKGGRGAGAGRAARETDLAAQVIEEFGQRFGGTMEFARARIEAWRETTLQSLRDAGLGHTQLADMVEEIARGRLAEAYREDLTNRNDWAAGVERGLDEIFGSQMTMADLAEEAVTTAFGSMEDAFVSLATTGKFEIGDLVEFALRAFFRLASQAAVANVTGGGSAIGGGGFLGSLFSLFTGPAPGSAASILHDGGVAGRDGMTRFVDPGIFAGAKRLHVGGLARNEVPAILEEDERVLTLAQQQATAATIRGLAALAAAGPSRATDVPAPQTTAVNVNIVGAPSTPSVEARQGRDGTLDIDVVFEQIEDRLASNISRGRGLAPAVAGRFNLRGAV